MFYMVLIVAEHGPEGKSYWALCMFYVYDISSYTYVRLYMYIHDKDKSNIYH